MKRFLYFLIITLSFSCTEVKPLQGYKHIGKTMGTYYNVSYFASSPLIDQGTIDLELIAINQELSTYIDTSTISQFNQSDKTFINPKVNNELTYKMFDEVFKTATDIFNQSQGYFDPTVMPLVNYWGFGYKDKKKEIQVDSQKVTELLSLVGFGKLTRSESETDVSYQKWSSEVQIDFSSIAKGYGVDMIGRLLENHGIQDFLIDIGGEILAKGQKPGQKPWTIAINKPQENVSMSETVDVVQLKDKAIASSGNYRNFYVSNGQKYSHTINPLNGYTERSHLLSTSILADNCMIADAYATACMVMGLEKAMKMVSNNDQLEACFISNKEGKLVFDYSVGWPHPEE